MKPKKQYWCVGVRYYTLKIYPDGRRLKGCYPISNLKYPFDHSYTVFNCRNTIFRYWFMAFLACLYIRLLSGRKVFKDAWPFPVPLDGYLFKNKVKEKNYPLVL